LVAHAKEMTIQNLTQPGLAKFRQLARSSATFIWKLPWHLGVLHWLDLPAGLNVGPLRSLANAASYPCVQQFPSSFRRWPWQVLPSVPQPVDRVTGKALALRATRWHLGAYSQGLALGSPSENSEKG
jgi:hypothetical protein